MQVPISVLIVEVNSWSWEYYFDKFILKEQFVRYGLKCEATVHWCSVKDVYALCLWDVSFPVYLYPYSTSRRFLHFFFSLPNRKNTTTHHQHPSFSLLPNKAINSIQLAKTVLVWYFTITSVLVERNPQFTESDLKIVRLYMTHSCIPPRVIVLVKALYDIPCLQTDLHRPHLWGHVRSQSGVKQCSLEGCWAPLPVLTPPVIWGRTPVRLWSDNRATNSIANWPN